MSAFRLRPRRRPPPSRGSASRPWRRRTAARDAIALDPGQRVSEHGWFFQGEPGMASAANRGFMSNAGFVVTRDGVVVFDALGTPVLGAGDGRGDPQGDEPADPARDRLALPRRPRLRPAAVQGAPARRSGRTARARSTSPPGRPTSASRSGGAISFPGSTRRRRSSRPTSGSTATPTSSSAASRSASSTRTARTRRRTSCCTSSRTACCSPATCSSPAACPSSATPTARAG